jgi:hypothetical protein
MFHDHELSCFLWLVGSARETSHNASQIITSYSNYISYSKLISTSNYLLNEIAFLKLRWLCHFRLVNQVAWNQVVVIVVNYGTKVRNEKLCIKSFVFHPLNLYAHNTSEPCTNIYRERERF